MVIAEVFSQKPSMRPMICASDRLNPGLIEGEGAALHLSKKKNRDFCMRPAHFTARSVRGFFSSCVS
jgi:hypothetical protein